MKGYYKPNANLDRIQDIEVKTKVTTILQTTSLNRFFSQKKFHTLMQISLKFIPNEQINNNSAF